MKPGQRLLQLTAGVAVTLATLSACRREVPPPVPTPIPDKQPAPKVLAPVHYALL